MRQRDGIICFHLLQLREQDERQREPSRQSLTPSPVESQTSAVAEEADNYDLKSFMDRWSSKEFCEAYRVLNFGDVVQRGAKLHSLGPSHCVVETITKALPVKDLLIGVIVFNQCPPLNEPEVSERQLRPSFCRSVLLFELRFPLS